MVKTIQIIVIGQVQGVGFRWATKQVADRMKVHGYVVNLINGTVKVIAQADQLTLKRFTAAIRKSPTPYGHVSKIKITITSDHPYSFFDVR